MASLTPPRLPQLKRQASGKTKPKAIAKANPQTPLDRQYPWGGKQVKGAPTPKGSNSTYGSYQKGS